jgi:metal-dependent amidase/aminoacylase/carboxypeptidase family protein
MIGRAFPMIQEGCLEGVDEVYGAHNDSMDPAGKLTVKMCLVAARITEIDIILMISVG